jgi:alpha-beta hydrolase superfamily lysophospholipase
MPNTPELLRPWRRLFEAPAVPAERIEVRARDGLRLVVHRVRYPNSGPAVLLLHGLGANRTAFHFPGRSLADWLASRGFDCYVAELRGHGHSERRRFDWDLDDYLVQDLPAIIDAVLERSGAGRFSWVGHSMGGILLFCYGILNPEAPIARGISVGAALDYRSGISRFRSLLRFQPLLEHIPALPYGTFAHLVAPLLGRTRDPLGSFNFWLPNVEPEVVRRAHAGAFHTIPSSLLRSLAQLFDDRGLHTRDGFFYLENAERYAVPTLLLAGSRDVQVSVPAVQATATLLGGEARVYGRDQGHHEDYGHWDLILGRRAFEEVWPDVADWLEADAR